MSTWTTTWTSLRSGSTAADHGREACSSTGCSSKPSRSLRFLTVGWSAGRLTTTYSGYESKMDSPLDQIDSTILPGKRIPQLRRVRSRKVQKLEMNDSPLVQQWHPS